MTLKRSPSTRQHRPILGQAPTRSGFHDTSVSCPANGPVLQSERPLCSINSLARLAVSLQRPMIFKRRIYWRCVASSARKFNCALARLSPFRSVVQDLAQRFDDRCANKASVTIRRLRDALKCCDEGIPQSIGIMDVGCHSHHHAAGFGLVQDIRRDDLHDHRKSPCRSRSLRLRLRIWPRPPSELEYRRHRIPACLPAPSDSCVYPP